MMDSLVAKLIFLQISLIAITIILADLRYHKF